MHELPSRRLLTALMALHVLAWTLVPWLVNTSLPLDVVREGLSWGHEFAWGYHKHPPLPSWLVEISFRAFGTLGPYLLAQLTVMATLWLVWRIGCRLLDPARALAGTLLLAGVPFFTWPSIEFNHNTAQMPLWALAMLLYLRVLKSDGWRDWMALAVVCALGLYTKYAFLVLIALLSGHLLFSAPRRLFSLKGLGALLILLGLLTPHLQWLASHDFQPLHYLGARSTRLHGISAHLLATLYFAGVQALNMLLPVLLWLALLYRHQRVTWPPARLLLLALGPVALVTSLILLTGNTARPMWATPMLSLTGLLLASLLPEPPAKRALQRLLIAALLITFSVLGLYAAIGLAGEASRHKPMRTGWPAAELSAAVTQAWSARTACPLRIVAGENWLAGVAAYGMTPRPQVFIDEDFSLSPWLTQEQVQREGLVRLSRTPQTSTSATGPDEVQVKISWPRTDRVEPLSVTLQIRPPARPCLKDAST